MKLTPSQEYIDKITMELRQTDKRWVDVLKMTGITSATISRARHGHSALSHRTIKKIDHALNEIKGV